MKNKNLKILSDFHHAGLLQSLILLFERRLGGEVYRPIGIEWFTQGYWKVYNHPATVEQFLGIGGATPDGTRKLNEVLYKQGDFVYICHDINSDQTNRAITLEGFMQEDFDIVIATLPYHIEPFKRLCASHPSKPKLIYQIGNAWTIDAGLAPNVMASAIINDVPQDIHFISYHQEFDTQIFHPRIPILHQSKNIYSFINVFNGQEHLASDWQLFQKMEKLMPDWTYKSYGGQCRDGSCDGTKALADKMRDARFIWHTKQGGDGYGHIIFNTGAVGVPMIVKKQYYAGKLGEKLMIDGETCVAIDGMSMDAIKSKIEYYNEPERYERMCHAVYTNFMQNVNFDTEAENLKTFLANLKP